MDKTMYVTDIWAKLLHRLMLNPAYADILMPLIRQFPYLCKKMFDWARV